MRYLANSNQIRIIAINDSVHGNESIGYIYWSEIALLFINLMDVRMVFVSLSCPNLQLCGGCECQRDHKNHRRCVSICCCCCYRLSVFVLIVSVAIFSFAAIVAFVRVFAFRWVVLERAIEYGNFFSYTSAIFGTLGTERFSLNFCCCCYCCFAYILSHSSLF